MQNGDDGGHGGVGYRPDGAAIKGSHLSNCAGGGGGDGGNWSWGVDVPGPDPRRATALSPVVQASGAGGRGVALRPTAGARAILRPLP